MLNPSIYFALLAMALIGAADAINKRARQADIPIGSYLLIQAPFFTVAILVITLISTGIKVGSMDILYGFIGAVFSFSAFTIMLHSLTRGHASINYAIFRLSFVFSSVVAFKFLNESLSLGKVLGLTLATLAVLIFFYSPGQHAALKRPLILALCAMIIGSCFQLTLKLATRVFSSSPSFLFLMSLFFALLVIIYNIIFGGFKIPRKTFFYAPLNGILMALGSLFVIIALSQGEVSTVFPIVQLSFIITLILSTVILKENINHFQISGVICAGIAIIILGCF